MPARKLDDFTSIASAVRTACVNTAIRAYEDAGMSGLCEEGRWEYAIAAMRGFDLQSLQDPGAAAGDREDTRPTSIEN